ncbi:expressed unknown protein [Seminavis robusta]|uniref:Uncharacterized protein n=1 Tax=Seminavis robusta TaxID=568900 RepID=A0A9N8EPS3_9STRA|nr:expressed unknown protein [Seminavis robusta]|eukprot:Sro1360_g266040.1 n/a (205) ;mRNA; r:1657-2527
MKLNRTFEALGCVLILTLLFPSITSADDASISACQSCKDKIPASRACVETCDNSCLVAFEEPEQVILCYQFNATCIAIVEDAADCFDDCLDDCVSESAADYGVCLTLNNGIGGCDAAACEEAKANQQAIDSGNVQGELDNLENQIDQTESDIHNLESEIEDTEEAIEDNEDEVDQLEEEAEDLVQDQLEDLGGWGVTPIDRLTD